MPRAWGDDSRRLRPFMGVATSFAGGTGVACGARRDVERLRVQEPDSPPDWWGMKREGAMGAGPGADDATLVDARAATSSASDTSDTETVREREELVAAAAGAPQRSRAVLVVAAAVVTSQPVPVPVPPLPLGSPASLLASSMPSTLMLLRRPLRRSRSMPCHISSVTPKRSRHLRSWRARESGRVSGLWHMAQGEGWPPCLAVLLR
jgi:hypothetical protein